MYKEIFTSQSNSYTMSEISRIFNKEKSIDQLISLIKFAHILVLITYTRTIKNE